MTAPCAYDPPETSLWDGWRQGLARLAVRGGPEPSEYRLVQSWLEGLAEARRDGALTPGEVQAFLTEGGPALSSCRTLLGLTRLQPHGYPGDFELIDRIYEKSISADPACEKWDRFFQAQAGPCAIRNAKAYFIAWLREAESRRHVFAERLELLHLGGGPGRELREYYREVPASRVGAVYVDPDPHGIAHAARLCAAEARVSFHQANPLSFLPPFPPHLIWAGGLFDALDRPNAVRLLCRLWMALTPGGELVISNVAPHHPTRSYLELAGWSVQPRHAAQLAGLAREAGAPQSAIRVGREAEGVIQFLHVIKPVPLK